MEINCVQRNNTFKFKLTLDRHNARLKLIYCLLPDPPRFSLPSTFKGVGEQHSPAGEGVGGPNSDDWRESLALCLLFGLLYGFLQTIA